RRGVFLVEATVPVASDDGFQPSVGRASLSERAGRLLQQTPARSESDALPFPYIVRFGCSSNAIECRSQRTRCATDIGAPELCSTPTPVSTAASICGAASD